jgi:nitrile hydratase
MVGALSPGDRVRVREDFPLGHIRTPVYVRGKEGVVTRVFGSFPTLRFWR